MSEVSVAKALSGAEALDACLYELRRVLSRDGRFQPHMAYQGFRAEIEFHFYPAMGFVPPLEREISLEEGDVTDIETEPTVVEKIVVPQRPPNQVREEADMPLPVLSTDSNGHTTEKWVKRGPKPKNIVRGG